VPGHELTPTFLLTVGGSALYLAKDPRGGGTVEALVGVDLVTALATCAAIDRRLRQRSPLQKPWIAARLAWQGHSNAEIARRRHASDVAVRGWL